ncbi:hypothetical protein [Schumannella sp. 10F1B-5-1]|uniref:hypothetical protein n=1 Tax=Schumannella sp. 10F1B-5-1 TaxID=2590780 RepID=UPI00112FDFFC|nr:hypothetical protein [Schumannella sp. 10F1B-5-1]TPW71635.1 hypothetical protein FJ658_09790 [Schumannella sp. 10F1B-5-1]
MRIGIYLGLLLAIAAVVTGALFLVALTSSTQNQVAAAVLGIGIAAVLLAPLVRGTIAATWDVAKDPVGLRRWRIVTGATAGVGVAAVIVGGVLVGTAPWAIAVICVVGIGGAVAAEPIGRRIGRASTSRGSATAMPTFEPLDDFVRTTLRRTGILIGIGLGLVIAIAMPFDLLREADDRGLLSLTLAAFPLLAGAVLIMFRGWNEGAVLRGWFDRDTVVARRVGKAITSGDDSELDDDERVLAARWASVSPTLERLRILGTVLLWLGLVASQAQFFLRDPAENGILFLVFVVTLLIAVVAVLLTLRRLRRVERYAESRRHLLEESAGG